MKNNLPKEPCMTVLEVAEYLNLHYNTVYKYAKNGKIPASKIGRNWRFRRVDIDKKFLT